MIKKLLDRQNNSRTTVKILSWCKRFYTNLKKRINHTRLISTQRTLRSKSYKPQKQKPRRKNQGIHKNQKTNYEELHLFPEEIEATEEQLFRYAQGSEFAEEIASLSAGQEIHKNSSIQTLIRIWNEEKQLPSKTQLLDC